MKTVTLLLACLTVVNSVFIKNDIGQYCLNCCGDGCCNDCGLSHHFPNFTQIKIEGKRVLSTRSFVDSLTDPFTGHIDPNLIDSGFGNLGPDQCLDCCGSHPCCNEAYCIGHNQDIFNSGHESGGNPERNETYGQQTDQHQILLPGSIHIPKPDETLPYYVLGKK